MHLNFLHKKGRERYANVNAASSKAFFCVYSLHLQCNAFAATAAI